ncbi:hypothetical protein [Photorhabdus sp. CRCIA-P01]|uniref:hypothetical protein n=1 Tax=Photorhabdus sp. CRCIA-P01 TaxID=2019570 RepID=UPI001E4C5E72|nr:hypothetical protein [Photorhabdus sp. CRCIA-P01]
MLHGIEEPTDVQIQHPIDFPLHNCHIQRVQAATGKVGKLGWTKRFEAMGMSKETAAAMTMTLPVIVEGSKGPKSSPTTKGTTDAVVNTEKAALKKIGQKQRIWVINRLILFIISSLLKILRRYQRQNQDNKLPHQGS